MCRCGHRRDRHQWEWDVKKPGPCNVRKCDCTRFLHRIDKHAALRKSADYEALVAKRGEVCWICGKPPGKRRLHIDHDHREMYVRGLLCFPCNARLDNRVTSRWLRDAADYLDEAQREYEGLADVAA